MYFIVKVSLDKEVELNKIIFDLIKLKENPILIGNPLYAIVMTNSSIRV